MPRRTPGPPRPPTRVGRRGPAAPRPTPSKRAITEGVFHNNSTALWASRVTESNRRRSCSTTCVVDVESDAARPDHASPKAVAAQHGRHVEHVAANASAIGHGRQEADVARQRAEIADMVGNPLQLQGHAAEELTAGRDAGCAEGLDGAAVGGGMSGGAVAGQRLRVVDRARIGAAQHRPFHSAMLVAQGDFQVVDRLAVALEAEMAGLDDAGVDRADGHFMDLVARHLEEVGHAALQITLTPCPSPIRPSTACRRGEIGKADRLQPGMTERPNVPLLEDFAFEEVGLRTIGRDRRILRTDIGRDDRQVAFVGHGQHGQ